MSTVEKIEKTLIEDNKKHYNYTTFFLKREEKDEIYTHWYTCKSCDYSLIQIHHKYCPNCGKKFINGYVDEPIPVYDEDYNVDLLA